VIVTAWWLAEGMEVRSDSVAFLRRLERPARPSYNPRSVSSISSDERTARPPVGINDDSGLSDHLRAYRYLKAALVEYRFRPGEQLLIGPLGDHLHISATPVREALVRLHAEALLDSTRKRGFYARILSPKEMTDLYQLRYTIIRQAIEICISSGQLPGDSIPCRSAALMQIGNGQSANSGTGAHAQAYAVEASYRDLVSLAGNEVMVDMLRGADERTHYIRAIDLEAPTRLKDAVGTLDGIFAAVRERDGASAVFQLGRDLDLTLRAIPSLVKEGIARSYALHDAPPDEDRTRIPVQASNRLGAL
jgi:DNA-binding GntR family transcriptional regulator